MAPIGRESTALVRQSLTKHGQTLNVPASQVTEVTDEVNPTMDKGLTILFSI
jgi:hypothetical protein